MEKKVKLKFERETKRTYRFQEDSETPIIGTLYVKQSVFEERPNRLEVLIKTMDK